MDDCNSYAGQRHGVAVSFRFPWTIVTLGLRVTSWRWVQIPMDDCNYSNTPGRLLIYTFRFLMDDCNEPEGMYIDKLESSDSSMDDCNDGKYEVVYHDLKFRFLWTIVTTWPGWARAMIARSDSSMDDCNTIGPTGSISNLVFRFLYGRL